jgi:hypothetical protein
MTAGLACGARWWTGRADEGAGQADDAHTDEARPAGRVGRLGQRRRRRGGTDSDVEGVDRANGGAGRSVDLVGAEEDRAG